MSTSILVVEDENIVAKDIIHRLKNLGYSVAGSASSGEDAVRLAVEARPDLVLMDIMLKGKMDGIEAAGQILDRLEIPVVYLTAYSDEETLQRAKVTEAFGYLLKPFEERDLRITIEMALFKHKMEKSLRESKEWLTAILKSIGDAVIATDAGGSISFMNSVAEELTGWTKDEAAGTPLHEVFRISEEGTGRPMRSPAERALSEGAAMPFEGTPVLHSRDGRAIPIDDSAAPIRTFRGEISGVVLVFRDVTERRTGEEAVRQSQAQLAGIVGSAMDAIISIDAEQRIVLFNAAAEKVFGCPASQAIGQSIGMFIPERFREAHVEHLNSFGREDATKRSMGQLGMLSGRRLTGEEFPLEASISQVEIGGRRLYTIILRDTTERSRMEEQLRQAQKMESIGTLASGIAHDFNNVLNNVLGYAMQLNKYLNDPVRVKKYAEIIEKSATRGAELASQLLSFARAGRRASVPTDLGEIINEVITACAEIFPPSVSIETEVEDSLLPVIGDHAELYQVLLNLLVNARDAVVNTGVPGTIVVRTRNAVIGKDMTIPRFDAPGATCIELKVTDTGTGIPDEIKGKIFDPFFTTKERGRGTGLGLSIVYNIVRSHQGTISVDSETGKGTTFSLYLPSVQPPAGPASAGGQVSPENAAKPLIMVVDDEEAMQELGKELLEDEGYRVIVASDGIEGVKLFKEHYREISLVVLDLVMPGMNGGQAYVEMKRINKDLKVFFCTGYIPDEIFANLVEQEQLKVITKPFRPDEFLRMVKEILESSPH